MVSIDVGDLKYEGSNGNNTSQKRLWPPLLRSEILFFSQSIIIVNCFSLSYFFFFFRLISPISIALLFP